jgi:magnesium chelatase subunit I
VLARLAAKALQNVFARNFSGGELESVVAAFQNGLGVEVSDLMSSEEYVKQLAKVPALATAVKKLGATEPAAMAAAMEFVLEGLHLGKKLNKDMKSGAMRYRSMS